MSFFSNTTQSFQSNYKRSGQKQPIPLVVKYSGINNASIYRNTNLEINIESKFFQIPDQLEIIQVAQDLQYLNHLKTLQVKISKELKVGVEELRNFKEGLQNHTKLENLYFTIQDQNNVGQKGLEEFSECFKYLNNLEKLTFALGGRNQVNADGLIAFGLNLKYLVNLKSLSLTIYENNIESRGFASLVENIKYLAQLTDLSITYQDIINDDSFKLGQSLSNLSQLKDLFLFVRNCQIGDLGCQGLGQGLKKLQNLTNLQFVINQGTFGEEGCKFLAEGLICLEQLQSINLNFSNNSLGQKGINYLGRSLEKLEKINKFSCQINDQESLELIYLIDKLPQIRIKEQFKLKYLSKCSLTHYFSLKGQQLDLLIQNQSIITDKGATALGRGIDKIQMLKCLNISFEGENKLNEQAIDGLSKTFKTQNQLYQLRFLISKGNQIGKLGAQYFGENMKYLEQLQNLSLEIGENEIEGEGFSAICDSIGCYQYLKSLNLNICRNNIGVIGSISLGRNLKKLINLTSLVLILGSDNNIQAEGMLEISEGIFSLESQIQDLQIEIGSNNVGDEGIQHLTFGISNLKALCNLELKIRSNQIGFQGGQKIGEMLSKLKTLKNLILVIGQNNISELGATQIGEGIKCLNELNYLLLDFDINNISEKGYQNIAKGINHLKSLNSLQLLYKEPEGINLLYCINSRQNMAEKGFQLNEIEIFMISRDLNNENVTELGLLFKFQGMQELAKLGDALQLFNQLQNLKIEINANLFQGQEFTDFMTTLQTVQQLNALSLIFSNEKNINGHEERYQQLIRLDLHSIGKLDFLQRIELDFKILVDDHNIISLASGLSSLKNLEKFSLLCNDILQYENQLCDSIVPLLKSINRDIISLNLRIPCNEIQFEQFIQNLNNGLMNFTNLKQLSIILQRLNGKYILYDYEVLQTISRFPHLTTINFKNDVLNQYINNDFKYKKTNQNIIYRKSKRLVVFNFTKSNNRIGFPYFDLLN